MVTWVRSPRTARRTTSARTLVAAASAAPYTSWISSDPSNAKQLPTWNFAGDGRPHSLNLNPLGFAPGLAEGTRAYMGQGRSWPFADAQDGLVITDVSDYQLRRPNPQIRIISTLFYPDQGTGESMIPVKIKGHPYIISPRRGRRRGRRGRLAGACARGVSAFGYPQIIDVADELQPEDHLQTQAASDRPGELRGAARRDAAGYSRNRAGDQFAGHFGDDQLQWRSMRR